MEDKHSNFLTIQQVGKRFEWSSSIFSKLISMICLALFFTAALSYQAVAQQTTITGTVTDANDDTGLPGVNIVIPGTTIGTTTDFDGNYSINVPADADSLRFSFIGYITQIVPIDGRTTINISLLPDTQMLEDVVVVGYGSQERKQITGSVTSVDEENFVKGAINNPDQLIQGKVPGLTISNQGGNPNSHPQIRLRGISSFGPNQEPLVVVDGIIGANLNNIDPNDIESMEVLKDASASAIYGTRGSGGVIIVTTKKGDRDDVQISYNAHLTGDFVEKQLDVLGAQEFLDVAEQRGINVTDGGAQTDWFDEITQTGLQNVHSLSISGGNESTTYRLSGNFRDVDGIQQNTGFQRINARLNLTHRALDDNLTLTFNLSGTDREEDIGFGSAFRYAATFNPTLPVKSEGFENTGGFTEVPGGFDVFNPVAIIRTGDNFAERKTFNIAGRIEYDFEKIIPGLTASGFYSLETNNNIESLFLQTTNKVGGNATQSSLGTGLAQQNIVDNQSELVEGTVNYVGDVGDLSVEVLGGYSWQNFIDEGQFVEGGDFIADAVGVNNLSFAQDFRQGEGTVSSFKSENRLVAGFGRVSLNWDDTYFLNGSARREGSSRFGANNKWGNFWSIGGSIEVTNLVEISKVSRLKIRASFGQTGQNAPQIGLSQQRFAPVSNFFDGSGFVQSFGPVSNANPDLKWEELEDRISGTVEFYDRETKDLIFPIEVSVPPNLFPTTFTNIGTLETDGVEMSISAEVIRNDNFSWNTTWNNTVFGDNELTKFVSEDSRFIANAGAPGLNETDLIRVKEGAEIGDIWGPKFSRFSTEADESEFDVAPGTFLCEAPDGEEFVCRDTNRDREQVLGNGLPEWQAGWTNNLTYKNFDFSLFVRGVFGHDMVNTHRLFFEAPGVLGNWNILSSGARNENFNDQPQFSSFQVEDGGFIRFENLTFGYTVPLKTDQIRRLRVYFSANNLATITDWSGVDPTPRFQDSGAVDGGLDLDGPENNALAPGIARRNNWFTTRSFTLGLNLDF